MTKDFSLGVERSDQVLRHHDDHPCTGQIGTMDLGR